MRHFAAVCLLVLVGCGGKQIQTPAVDPNPVPPFLIEYSMQVFSSYGFASACAAGRYVYTAKHVLMPFIGIPELHNMPIGYAWSDHSGREGVLDPVNSSPYRDLALLKPSGGQTPFYHPVSLVPPSQGDVVWWVEYNKRGDDGDFFAPVIQSAKVIRTIAGHVTFDIDPRSGASGTCLFNGAGQVVGVIMWGFPPTTGVAVLLTGHWGFEE